jgi:hypothetical protein
MNEPNFIEENLGSPFFARFISEMLGIPPPSGEDALRLSSVRHFGRDSKSDRMRRPPSLAGSERREIEEAKPRGVLRALRRTYRVTK